MIDDTLSVGKTVWERLAVGRTPGVRSLWVCSTAKLLVSLPLVILSVRPSSIGY